MEVYHQVYDLSHLLTNIIPSLNTAVEYGTTFTFANSYLVGCGCVFIRVVSQPDGETFTRLLALVTRCTYSAVVVIEQGLIIPTVNYTAPRYKCLTLFTTHGLSHKQSAIYHVDDAPTLHVCMLSLSFYRTFVNDDDEEAIVLEKSYLEIACYIY